MTNVIKTTINFIGAGKLGKMLARLLINTGHVSVKGICNTTLASSQAAIDFIGQGEAYKNIAELPSVDLTFITTPDYLIQSCCEQLSQSEKLQANSIIAHCSGILASEVLAVCHQKHCAIASIHPMYSFAALNANPATYHGTFCATEGDKKAVAFLTMLFTQIGAKVIEIDPKKKPLYHAAGVFASNYLVTLFQQGLHCLTEASVELDTATDIILRLMQNTVSNLTALKQAKLTLTGPIQRGDIAAIENQLANFSNFKMKALYKILGLATLDLTDLPQPVLNQLITMFSAPEDL